jgi:hypothetical protein
LVLFKFPELQNGPFVQVISPEHVASSYWLSVTHVTYIKAQSSQSQTERNNSAKRVPTHHKQKTAHSLSSNRIEAQKFEEVHRRTSTIFVFNLSNCHKFPEIHQNSQHKPIQTQQFITKSNQFAMILSDSL